MKKIVSSFYRHYPGGFNGAGYSVAYDELVYRCKCGKYSYASIWPLHKCRIPHKKAVDESK